MEAIKRALEELRRENESFKSDGEGNIIFDLREEALYHPEAIYMLYVVQKYNLIFLIKKNSILIHYR